MALVLLKGCDQITLQFKDGTEEIIKSGVLISKEKEDLMLKAMEKDDNISFRIIEKEDKDFPWRVFRRHLPSSSVADRNGRWPQNHPGACS